MKDTSTIVSTLQIQLRLKSKPVLHRKLELTGWLKLVQANISRGTVTFAFSGVWSPFMKINSLLLALC